MEITVAICTWNRSRILRQTLTAMEVVTPPKSASWELLVIDNNSSDDTAAVAREFESKLPVRYVFEPQSGKANAANTAAREARGELLIWTDDDVFPVPNWIQAYADAANQWTDAAVFGGPITPHFEGTPPPWLLAAMPIVGNAYGVRSFGSDPFRLRLDTLPYGANFAVRTEIQRRYMFDRRRGVNAGTRVGGYETGVIAQILNDGLPGWWVPQASVEHFVRAETQSVKFLRKYFVAQGKAAALRTAANPAPCSRLWGRPRWLLRQALQAEFVYRWKRLLSRPDSWVPHLVRSSELWGEWISSKI